MIYKTISAKAIITKVYRDLDPQFPDWEWDAVEWIAEALRHIGAYAQYIKKDALLEVVDHRAAWPIDFVSLLGVTYAPGATVASFADSYKRALRRSSSVLHPGVQQQLVSNASLMLATMEESYQPNPDYIHTTFAEGVVGISYQALPIDDDGYPLVPDDPSYGDAMFWYIARKLFLRGLKHPDPSINYLFADREWKWYAGQARNEADMPDIDEFENLLKQYVHMARVEDRNANFFRNYEKSNIDVYYDTLTLQADTITLPLTQMSVTIFAPIYQSQLVVPLTTMPVSTTAPTYLEG